VFGTAGVGWFLAKLLIFMVLTSAAASTQTTILPTARTVLSMSVFKALPDKFKRIHPRTQIPTWATVGMGIVSVGFYLLMTRVSSNILTDSIGSIGLMIAFYYGLTGFSCVWYYRKVLTRSPRDAWTKGVMPFLGGVLLLFFFVYGCYVYADKDYGTTYWTLPFAPHWQLGGVFLTGIGALLVGLVLMIVYRFVRPIFFKGETIPVSNAAEPGPEGA
jgi:amino acid transporter